MRYNVQLLSNKLDVKTRILLEYIVSDLERDIVGNNNQLMAMFSGEDHLYKLCQAKLTLYDLLGVPIVSQECKDYLVYMIKQRPKLYEEVANIILEAYHGEYVPVDLTLPVNNTPQYGER